MVEEQKGLCKICQNPPGQKGLVVDHCHVQGHVRGLLCGLCNASLGGFKDSVGLLSRAAKYLLETRRYTDAAQ